MALTRTSSSLLLFFSVSARIKLEQLPQKLLGSWMHSLLLLTATVVVDDVTCITSPWSSNTNQGFSPSPEAAQGPSSYINH